MTPYAELLEFNQPNPFRKPGFTRIRDAFPELSVEFFPEGLAVADGVSTSNPERIVEFAGGWDYGESNAAKLGTRKDSIIRRWIDMGHESMLEMGWACFFLEGSRVWSHEMVRHRPVSLQQESQRFVKYDNEEPEDMFFFPPELSDTQVAEAIEAYRSDIALYKKWREEGLAPQIARYVLPNAMRTRMVFATNLREWRHICKLRLDKSAQPEMQELMKQIYDQLVDVFPNVMYDALGGERGVR